jgi:hypothetical protein
MEIKL